MPDPKNYETEKEWMAACVPVRMDEGDEQDQAVAVCLNMWRDRNKSIDLVSLGGAVKSLGDGRVGGYLVRYSTDEDPDMEQEFFDADTDYMFEFPGKSAAWFSHAMYDGKKQLTNPAMLSQDDFGIWAETILDERDQYEKFLLELAGAGKLGWSSGTASHLVEREPKGKATHITRWPLGLDASLTHIPAEPRNTVIPLKSLSELLPPFPEQEAEPEADSDGGEVEAKEIGDPIITEKPLQEDLIMEEETKSITMTPEELKAVIGEAVTAAVKSLPANDPPKAKTEVTVTIDEADRPFKTAGEFYQAVANKARGMASDVRLKSLKVPDDDGYFVRAFKAEPTGLGEEQPVYGGYLVGTDTQAGLVERMYADGEVLNRVPWINISANANGIVLNGLDETSRADGSRWGGVLGYWLAEAGSLTATKPAFRQMHLRLNKVAAAVYMTDELLADAAAVESYVNNVAPAELRFKVEDAIINGSGAGKPKGIITDSAIYVSITAETGQASTTLVYENVLKAWSRMWAPSRRNAVWYINQDVEPQLNAMQLAIGTAGVPVYLPAGGASGQPYGTLFGRPVIPIEYCPTLGTLGDITLADMSQYVGIRKGGIQAASSMHVEFLTDQMVYRFIYRVDGQPLWHSSLTPKSGSSNTLSPFIVVATR